MEQEKSTESTIFNVSFKEKSRDELFLLLDEYLETISDVGARTGIRMLMRILQYGPKE